MIWKYCGKFLSPE